MSSRFAARSTHRYLALVKVASCSAERLWLCTDAPRSATSNDRMDARQMVFGFVAQHVLDITTGSQDWLGSIDVFLFRHHTETFFLQTCTLCLSLVLGFLFSLLSTTSKPFGLVPGFIQWLNQSTYQLPQHVLSLLHLNKHAPEAFQIVSFVEGS